MEWTAEAIETLQALWAEGHSTAEIGRRMGISKNAVVGKAHRLNLSARPSPIRREDSEARATESQRQPAAPRPAPAPRPVTPPPAPVVAVVPPPVVVAAAPVAAAPVPRPAPPPVPVVARSVAPPPVVRAFPRLGGRSCCWPIGEPGTPDFRFCTAEASSGRPYCAEHASIAYVKARDRREDAA